MYIIIVFTSWPFATYLYRRAWGMERREQNRTCTSGKETEKQTEILTHRQKILQVWLAKI
jgi:hypothetical protein